MRLANTTAPFLLLGLFAYANPVLAQRQPDPPRLAVVTSDFQTDGPSTDGIQQTQFMSSILPPLLRSGSFGGPPVAPSLIPTASEQATFSARIAARAPRTRRRRRLSSVPDMMGDFFFPPSSFNGFTQPATTTPVRGFMSQLPVAGGGFRTKIGEFNKALPVDRAYANWNHYHDAIEREFTTIPFFGAPVTDRKTASLDRLTLGFERTIFGGDASIEVRAPISLYPTLDDPGLTSDTGVLGNLSIIPKVILWSQNDQVISAGLGLELPTGADGSATMVGPDFFDSPFTFRVENQTVILPPFIAAQESFGSWFFNVFAQLDLPLNGNTISMSSEDFAGAIQTDSAVIDPQPLAHFDVSLGRWLMRNRNRTGLTGVAAVFEYHLTNTLEDADSFTFSQAGFFGDSLTGDVTQVGNQITSMNFTAGLHFELANSTMIRIATVHPLRSGDDRLFDSEFMLQIGRRF